MTAFRNARILLICTALLIGAAVWVASTIQRNTADAGHSHQADAQALLTGMLDMQTGFRGFQLTGAESYLEPFTNGKMEVVQALDALSSEVEGEAASEVAEVEAIARRWQELAILGISDVRLRGTRAVTISGVRKRKLAFDAFRVAQARLAVQLDTDRKEASSRAGLVTAGVALALAFAIGLVGSALLGRREREERRRRQEEEAYREAQAEFAETMQLAESEDEAHDLLRRHLERSVARSSVVVLKRDNDADRLQPATPVESPVLAQRLESAQPRSCLAIRLGRPTERSADAEPLMTCEICGATPEDTTCRPVVVGSEVIGSVLVTHHEPLSAGEESHFRDSVAQSAPALANLRNLSLAETRAATDALTGLPNRRSIEETLKRMLAQASRTMQPLSVLMIDVDHFKTINDLYGHEAGDHALTALGGLLTDTLRDSDFAGRQGGEEFIVLAPATDAVGAVTLAENLRAAVERLQVPGLEHRLSASIGVATFPDAASGATGVIRMADQALYAAKENGRNRVESASAPGSNQRV